MEVDGNDRLRVSDLHNAFQAHGPLVLKGVGGQDTIDTAAMGRFIGYLGRLSSKRHTNLLKTLNRVKVGVISPGGIKFTLSGT